MEDKKCFVICPIGEEGSDIRNRSDEVFTYVIEPTVRENGYKAIRADHIDKPGSITTQIVQEILTAPLVIADLTGQNPNVFYELALRHATRKPVVQIIQKGERLPFDVATQRTIELDHKSLGSAEEAKRRLNKQIKEVQNDPAQVDSPLAAGLQILDLQQSGKPIDKTLAEILLRLEELILAQNQSNQAVENLIRSASEPRSLQGNLDSAVIRKMSSSARLDQLTADAFLPTADKLVDQSSAVSYFKLFIDKAIKEARKQENPQSEAKHKRKDTK